MGKTPSPTLGDAKDYSGTPGVRQFHQAIRGERPTEFHGSLDVAGGPVRFVVLQPEQIVALRQQLLAAGIDSLAAVDLPPRDAQEYAGRRALLVRLLQACCRRAEGRASLVFPGPDGAARLSLIDDGKLIELARKVVEFGELFTPRPEVSVDDKAD